MNKLIGIFFLGLVGLAAIMAMNSRSNTPAQPEACGGCVERMSVGQLLAEYRRDPDAADRRLQYRRVQLSGTVASVVKSYVIMGVPKGGALIIEDSMLATAVTEGQPLTVTCQMVGHKTAGEQAVFAHDCAPPLKR